MPRRRMLTEPQLEMLLACQRPLPDGTLRVVACGEKQDGDGELVNLAGRASQRHEPLPLPLMAGIPDRPDDAATVAVVENRGRRSS